MNACYHDYWYKDAASSWVEPSLLKGLAASCGDLRPGARVLDVGCGNGFLAGDFLSRGCRVVGIELSETGVDIARANHPEARFEVLSADERMLENLGEAPFDIIVSMEVVEHLYSPRAFARGCFS